MLTSSAWSVYFAFSRTMIPACLSPFAGLEFFFFFRIFQNILEYNWRWCKRARFVWLNELCRIRIRWYIFFIRLYCRWCHSSVSIGSYVYFKSYYGGFCGSGVTGWNFYALGCKKVFFFFFCCFTAFSWRKLIRRKWKQWRPCKTCRILLAANLL